MEQRSRIKPQLIQAWYESIEVDYYNQRINSERSLQASFWSHLNHLLGRNRCLFIEPTLAIHTKRGKKTIIPDIVVCNKREVISVIELKYLPRAKPRYKKDIESLALIAENTQQIAIANQRVRGKEKDSKQYSLSKQILFVWAGVHAKKKSKSKKSYAAGYDSLDGCYLEFHALTQKKMKPQVSIRDG